jgi:DNA-binding transcriptional LysR family regulator
VSRQLIGLEEMLGTTLVERTTRHLALTEAGRLYQERAKEILKKEILKEVAEAERGLTAQTAVASGRLYVSAPSLLGRIRLSSMLPIFLAKQAQVSIDLMLVDRPVRIAEEGIDVALRIGPLEDSGLIASKLDDIQLVVCAAPDYLRRRGEPATPDDDLIEQDCLGFGDVPGMAEWSFQDAAARRAVRISTRLCANDLDVLVRADLAGVGLVRVPSWQVADFLADGRLRTVLEAYQRPPAPLTILTLRKPIATAKGTRLCRLSAATLDASATTSLEFPGPVHDACRLSQQARSKWTRPHSSNLELAMSQLGRQETLRAQKPNAPPWRPRAGGSRPKPSRSIMRPSLSAGTRTASVRSDGSSPSWCCAVGNSSPTAMLAS